jgi:hypothetical protein
VAASSVGRLSAAPIGKVTILGWSIRPSGLSFAGFTSAMPSALGSCLSAWERSRQPEPWEHAVVEAGEGADPVAGEGEDEQAGPMADAGGGAKVGPERRLAVGSRRHQVNPPARAEDAGEEAGHDVAALVFEGIGGMETWMSSVSKATSASRSPDS